MQMSSDAVQPASCSSETLTQQQICSGAVLVGPDAASALTVELFLARLFACSIIVWKNQNKNINSFLERLKHCLLWKESQLAQALSTSSDWCLRLSKEASAKQQLEEDISALKLWVKSDTLLVQRDNHNNNSKVQILMSVLNSK